MFWETTNKILELVKLINQIEVKFEYLEKLTTKSLSEYNSVLVNLKERVEVLEKEAIRREADLNAKIFALEERFKTVTQNAILNSANQATTEKIAKYLLDNNPDELKKLLNTKLKEEKDET